MHWTSLKFKCRDYTLIDKMMNAQLSKAFLIDKNKCKMK